MKKPFFSVIIPTYNRANLLNQTLESLKMQIFSDYEAFVIDDGSSDETSEVFKKYSDNQNWNFIRLEKNKGQAYCRNLAIKQANGKFLTFLDADDVWLPGRLEKFYKLSIDNNDTGFIFSNGYIFQDNTIIGKFFRENRKIPTGKLYPYMAISNYWLPYVTTNVAFLKEAIAKIGYFREDMSHLEDMELYTKVLKYYKVDYIPEPLSVYRIHSLSKNPQSLTLKYEKGLEDFLISLDTANPPPEVSETLKNYVYYNQAVIYLKNGFGEKTRECIGKIGNKKNNYKTFLLYAFSFTPKFVLAILRFFYKKYRTLKLKAFAPEEFGKTEKWFKELGREI
ncbi:MAG: glycosyltransferase family 2 protein [Elusimicrobia bacterium]|nr:glycosyltransferase family 2 protein [Elusimicrobiota bacterium]